MDLPTTGSNPEKKDESRIQQDSTLDSIALLNKESPGVRRVEILSSHIHLIDRIFLFSSIFLVSYIYGLDNSVRSIYQVWPPFFSALL